MFGERTRGISFATSRSSAFCAGENPVVPMTTATLARAHAFACFNAASAAVKSMATSTPRERASSMLGETGTPASPVPATIPASRPIWGLSGLSVAAASRSCGSARTAVAMRPPIRPPRPPPPPPRRSPARRRGSCDPVALQRRLHLRRAELRDRHEREADVGQDPAHLRQGVLHGHRVRLAEQRANERSEADLLSAGGFEIGGEEFVAQAG